GGLLDGFDDLRRERVAGGDFELHLGQHVGRVFGPAVNLRLALLPAEALDLGDRHPGDTDRAEGFAHLVELEWFDDGNDELHHGPLLLTGSIPAEWGHAMIVPVHREVGVLTFRGWRSSRALAGNCR